jgi:hypothetical protein
MGFSFVAKSISETGIALKGDTGPSPKFRSEFFTNHERHERHEKKTEEGGQGSEEGAVEN